MPTRYDKRLAEFTRNTWNRLESQRIIETSFRLRKLGYKIRVQMGMKSTSVAGISLLLNHHSIGILYRPVSPVRPPEAVIAEVEEKYMRILEGKLGEEMARLTYEITKEGMKRIGKYTLIGENMEFD